VIALQAQDHYLRVTTRSGSTLVLYRFSDALREMEQTEGIRVHRSHWVARSALQRLVARNGRHFLLLSNGERIPVSRTYLDRVRQQLN
jgi:DNA-binding LytR/AlgR family response regulator